MRLHSFGAVAGIWLILATPSLVLAAEPITFVHETPTEFFASGDFDGDGRRDLVIVDKESGKYRLGFQTDGGQFSWVDCRPSGLKGVTGFSLGRVLAPNQDGLVFTAPDANQLTLVEAASPTAPGKPVMIAFSAGLGPNSVVAVRAGGPGSTPRLDLLVGSIYNSPDPNLATLLRNDGSEYAKISEATLPGPAARANRVALNSDQAEMACFLITEDQAHSFRAVQTADGKVVTAIALAGLPHGTEYVAGNFRGQPAREFLFYKPGENRLTVRPVDDAGGKPALGTENSFTLDQPVRRLVVLDQTGGPKLLVVFGEGEKAVVYKFDGTKAPAPIQTFMATNELFTCAATTPEGFVIFTKPADGKFSTKYQAFKAGGEGYVASAFGTLPSLADNDNITIPDIHARIATGQKAASESEMKAYTNAIPGTTVKYVMLPIPGGEFVMGSPGGEPDRKPDEGPQHKVKILPFWMGQCEVTWNEYELFMYPDEEHRIRATGNSDATGDKLADAVTHPSKPYVEMSFGMGKDGYPAISMTHHAANKYCQWLSAKTGHFYRLPTEAEWEYACRAGTTTTYFFGSESNKLGEYAWFEQNSDFKYQKVGKKKPNPWGLYDMYGNVTEWVLDQYEPNYYQQCVSAKIALEPWDKATKPYPHSVRGGSWDDEASRCRSAARRGSDRTWKMTDPQLPKSVWYLSDAQWVGFRIIRPLEVPPPEAMQKYWTSGTERD